MGGRKKVFIQLQQDPEVRCNALPSAHPSDLAVANISHAGESLGDGTLGFSIQPCQAAGRGSVPGGESPTAGATSPRPLSSVPTYGCAPPAWSSLPWDAHISGRALDRGF